MKKLISIGSAVLLAFASIQVIAGGNIEPPRIETGNVERVQICHKPGTPAQKTMAVPTSAVDGHEGHGDIIGETCADCPGGDC